VNELMPSRKAQGSLETTATTALGQVESGLDQFKTTLFLIASQLKSRHWNKIMP